ncbi:FliM/FliN family flagellar motor C-terminal domain-containing protein [Variovorax arabinosiphilus]|uniref:FliM/FliN family flagellar motor C-terminal domain-containing protein n=1 Tax=Variovorax arabinosiphilus TaxID=3053498 RepID=UPI0025752FD8|nr:MULTISPECIES: FliM/FliN family flagellar motor C-terminal domain-containing protein [unclassified Variovorax]MDM0122198.1 FliM/FliN family flagellar motor C-terminal domain-containing protein [Variovorax sp. J2L1-78]MDM0131273.1 FliM/FliN family flagellar motor C-terminal domain-containing protein [Variovorax sp. J2L1-63]MDM0234961.1 FliM/FliN family flagellar motor C-terminal domain-containing protein [Variovorax sp. J2R1-6]
MNTPSEAIARHGSASALLSLEESARRVRPLHWWSQDQQAMLRRRFAALLQAWGKDWLSVERLPDELEVAVIASQEGATLPDTQAMWAYDDAQGQDPQRITSSVLAALTRQLFDFDPLALIATRAVPQITLTVARAALDDWLDRLRRLFGAMPLVESSDPGRLSSSVPSAWSGALEVRMPWCGGVWHLHLPHEAVAAILGTQGVHPSSPRPLVTEPIALQHALSGKHLAVRVILDGTQLSLGQLRELQVGDVVTLAHALDKPAALAGADGAEICSAWLGQADGRVAVELAPLPAAAVPVGVAVPTNIHPSKGQSK